MSKPSLRSSNAGDRDDSEHYSHHSLRPPPLNSASLVSFLPIPSPPQTPRFKKPKKKASQQDDIPPVPTIEPPDPGEPEIKLDTDFGKMDGIIDLTVLVNGGDESGAGSPSEFGSSGRGDSYSGESSYGALSGSPQFTHPWQPGGQLNSGTGSFHPRKPSRKVSPNTIAPLLPLPEPPVAPAPEGAGPHAEGWTAPESWSVAVKDGMDPVEEAESSSDESVGGTRHRDRASGVPGHHNGHGHVHGNGKSQRTEMAVVRGANGINGGAAHAKDEAAVLQAKRAAGAKKTAAAQHKIQIRIYKADNTYHVVSVSTSVTVATLTPKLDQKLPVGEEREMHQLYLKERGRG